MSPLEIAISPKPTEPRAEKSQKTTRDRRIIILNWLLRLQSQLNRLSGLAVGILLIYTSLWSFSASRAKLLWFDELLGLAVANGHSVSDVITALKAKVDYSAPLYHILAHFAIQTFGYSAASARLPAFFGICSMLIALYFIVSKRLAPIYGLLAVILVLCTPAKNYAWEGRPYGLVLGFTACALLAYQYLSDQRRRTFALAVYSICCAGLVATHYFAILVIGAFIVGELVRLSETRKIDWPVLIATVLSPAAVFILLNGVIRAQMVHRPATDIFAFSGGYDRFRFTTWAFCIAIGLIALCVWLQRTYPLEVPTILSSGFRTHELAVCGALLLLPIVGAVFGRYLTHAYIARYFISEVIGLSVLVCYVLAGISRRFPAVIILTIVAGTGVLLKEGLPEILRGKPGSLMVSFLDDTKSPILFETANDFLQAYQYYPERRAQFWYAAQPEMAEKFKRDDLEDINLRALGERLPMQVTTLEKFARANPSFVMIPKASSQLVGWVSQCLFDAGAQMKVTTLTEGKVVRSEGTSWWQPIYLFKVTLPGNSGALLDGCQTATSPSS
jgi:hypothetical protein